MTPSSPALRYSPAAEVSDEEGRGSSSGVPVAHARSQLLVVT